MTTYSKATPDVYDLLDSVLGRWHQPLKEAGVQFGVLMAHNSEGAAVKHGGYPATATIKVVSTKDRLTKGYDAELLIDETAWQDMNEHHREALLHHETLHLALVDPSEEEAANGEKWKTDDLGRPKLRLVKGDFHAGDGFDEVVKQHGDYAIEVLSMRQALSRIERLKREGADAVA